jgi:hypothetical protein
MSYTSTSLGLQSSLDAIGRRSQIRSWHTSDGSSGLSSEKNEHCLLATNFCETYQKLSKRELLSLSAFMENVFLRSGTTCE